MAASQSPSSSPLSGTTVFLICLIAAIGFAFDIYELLMLPLILRDAVLELGGAAPGSEKFNYWLRLMFYVPAFAGGIFGLLGGYLTDRFGRRRVLTFSILLYAFSAFFAGFSTSLPMLLVLRCTTFIGVCVEFVAAVAWLAELFPDPKRREQVLGYTQAFSSVGGLLVAVANGLAIDFKDALPTIAMPGFLEGTFGQIGESYAHAPWRYTLMSGLIPAIPLIVIRPFLPESPVWAEKRAAGTLRRPSIAAIFAPEYRRTTIVTTIGFACSLGAAFGAIQQMPQIVPGLAEVKAKSAKVKEATVAKLQAEGKLDAAAIEKSAKAAAGAVAGKAAAEYTKVQEIGGLVGRFLMAFAIVRLMSWGWTLRLFQFFGLLVLPALFWFFVRIENTQFYEIDLTAIYLGHLPITTMSIGMFLAGLFTVAQLSFWGNYLPHVYPTHLRGTGESFAANIGGRMIGTSAAAATLFLADYLPFAGDGPTEVALRFGSAAAIIGGACYLVGIIVSFMLPEPASVSHDE